MTWNPGGERIKGYSEKEALGLYFSRFFTEEDVQLGKPKKLLSEAARRGRVVDEGWGIRKDRSRLWADSTLTAIRGASGEITGYAKVTRDITERKRAHHCFVEQVLATLSRTGANPQKLRLELTESMFVESFDEIIAKMTTLKAHGLRFSIDDFGTGFSSLSYLKRLPIDEMKIDRSFVHDIVGDVNSGAIAESIVLLGRALGLSVIAYSELWRIKKAATRITRHTLPSVYLSGELQSITLFRYTLLADYVDPKARQGRADLDRQIDTANSQIDSVFHKYDQLIDSPTDKQLFESHSSLIARSNSDNVASSAGMALFIVSRSPASAASCGFGEWPRCHPSPACAYPSEPGRKGWIQAQLPLRRRRPQRRRLARAF
jgi:PAS domain S-box-containing protein